jgi:outer membrane protein OmpA-like peptidoglycan-associated protein
MPQKSPRNSFLIQRQAEKEEEPLQAKGKEGGTLSLASSVEPSIASLRGTGSPLHDAERAFFEPRFGSDFRDVRVHTDGQAGALAEAVQAKAFTVGRDVFFGTGQYAPGGSESRNLLAHELTHVVQQRGSPLAVQRQPIPSGGKQPAKRPLTRPEEISLSITSPGEIALETNPPLISLYNFAIDKATLKERHVDALQLLGSLIKQFPGGNISAEVKGHADSTGDDKTVNQPLSENRSQSVQQALQKAAGGPVSASHCGELCPVATNDTVNGRSRNRRVDIRLSAHTKDDHVDWPSFCTFFPEICLCLTNPETCRKKNGNGIDWPSLCSGELGKLLCFGFLCLVFEICSLAISRVVPEL